MKNTATTTDPDIAEILRWFDDAGLSVSSLQHTSCEACATPAAA